VYIADGNQAGYFIDENSNYAELADGDYGIYAYRTSDGSAAGYFLDDQSNYAYIADGSYGITAYNNGNSAAGYFSDGNSNYAQLADGSYGITAYNSDNSAAGYFGDASSNYAQFADGSAAGTFFNNNTSETVYIADGSYNYNDGTVFIASGNIYQAADNIKHYLGGGNNASITYDGTNLIIDPKESGAGILQILGTASGLVLHAEEGLSSSGTLAWDGSASGDSLWVSTFAGAGLTDSAVGRIREAKGVAFQYLTPMSVTSALQEIR